MKERDLSERDKERKLDKVESVCRMGKRNYSVDAVQAMGKSPGDINNASGISENREDASNRAQETEKYFEKESCIDERDIDDERVGKRAIYLVFSFAPVSSMARAIIAYTEGNFSHVAIALDESLTNMYSFTINQRKS